MPSVHLGILVSIDIGIFIAKKKMRIFDGKCYWFDDTRRTYSSAVAECQKEGGKVATFEDDAKVKKAAKAL